MPIKYPCSSCQKPCKSNQRCICCDICQLWTHLICITLTLKEFDILGSSDLTYFCQSCINDTFPFSLITDAELLDEGNSGKQTFQKAHLPNFGSLDKYSSYISAHDFYKTYMQIATIFFFYTRIFVVLNKNFDKLEDLLTRLGKLPDVIAITETKLSSKLSSFLQGYKFEQSNSKTLAGGVGLFIRDSLDYQIINDYLLNVEDCEELWAKVKLCNTEIIFCVIYRHPIPKFNEFQSSLECS